MVTKSSSSKFPLILSSSKNWIDATSSSANVNTGYNNVVNIKNVGITLLSRRHFRPKWSAPTLRELKRRKDIETEKAQLKGEPTVFHRSTFLEWNYDAELFAFGNRLGEKFEDALLRQALTHRSYVERENKKLESVGVESSLDLKLNDDLAVDGGLMITRFIKGYLRAVFTSAPEEMILAVHDYLVSTSVLADVGKHIGLGEIMLCADFPCQPETYVKSLQAIVAALEKSSGEERARTFVQDMILPQLYGKDVNELWNVANPVGTLASILKREGKAEPEFRLTKHTGSNTILAVYHVGVYSDKNFIAEGAGESIEIAQEMAAREALKRFFNTEDSAKALPFGRQLKAIQAKVVKLENQPNIPLSEWASGKVSIVSQ
uniref:Large ribosomal subunit protein mL44 n=1 Tax=Alona affinis TaxID=381656 RepID=A0A9N6WSW1_9CRUS|nr:EOG090X0DYO [Alona affinis]